MLVKSLNTVEILSCDLGLEFEAESENLSVVKDWRRQNKSRLLETSLFLVDWLLTVSADGNKV